MSDLDRPLSEQPETPDEISEPSPEPGYRFGRAVSWLPFIGLAIGCLAALFFKTRGAALTGELLFLCLAYPVTFAGLDLLGWLLLRHRLDFSPRWFRGRMRLVTLLLLVLLVGLLAGMA